MGRSAPPAQSATTSARASQRSYNARLVLVFTSVFTLTVSVGILGLTAYYVSWYKDNGQDYNLGSRLEFVVACVRRSSVFMASHMIFARTHDQIRRTFEVYSGPL